MSRLLTLKQALSTMEDLDFAPDSFFDEGSDFDEEDIDASMWDDIMMMNGMSAMSGLNAELADLLADSYNVRMDDLWGPEPPKKKRKTAEGQAAKETKKEKKEKKTKKSAQPVFDLVEPDFAPSKPSKTASTTDLGDPYGEATSLQFADAADKTARKKSLRFHTSKIESASAKRKGARDRAMGGDDDIPYRERRKEKEARLAKEAAAKGLGQGGEDLDDTEPHPPKASAKAEKSPFDEDEDMEDGDGYYELVKKASKEKKEKKKAEYEAANARYASQLSRSTLHAHHASLSRPDFQEQETDGPRSLTRAILANKGLTPHRPKSVRNPRVKKRLKFEKAKKKLSSQKAVYKGGLAQHGKYEGERSGISKVVKSIPLG